jgi:hypothetical protein
MYAETKFLLFTIIKSLPEKEVNECATVEATLNAAWKWAKEHNDKVPAPSCVAVPNLDEG